VGVPPFVGVAVKVTKVPAQIVLEGEAAIVTLTGTEGATVIDMDKDEPSHVPPTAVRVKIAVPL
jgi:hypothetical protein